MSDKSTTLNIPADKKKMLKQLALDNDTTMEKLVVDIVESQATYEALGINKLDPALYPQVASYVDLLKAGKHTQSIPCPKEHRSAVAQFIQVLNTDISRLDEKPRTELSRVRGGFIDQMGFWLHFAREEAK